MGHEQSEHVEKEEVVVKTTIRDISFVDPKIWHCSTYKIQHLQTVQQLAVTILEPVSLIDDHTAPRDLPQLRTVG